MNINTNTQLNLPLSNQDVNMNLVRASECAKGVVSPLVYQSAHKYPDSNEARNIRVSIPYISIKSTYITYFNLTEINSPKDEKGNSKNDQSVKSQIRQAGEDNNGYEPQYSSKKSGVTYSNKSGRNLSRKSAKTIKQRINTLVSLSENKQVKLRKSSFTFKTNFITLTLPSLQRHTDIKLKRQFAKFLDKLREKQQLNFRNYVWRAESQQNGNIHFHIVSDSFIGHRLLRRSWNRVLSTLGYISSYADKFRNMSEQEYIEYRCTIDSNDTPIVKFIDAYKFGVKTGWTQPNTTDIHRVDKIKNVGAYVAKYCAKNPELRCTDANDEGNDISYCNDEYTRMAYQNGIKRYDLKERRIKGKKWGSSQSLSRIKGALSPIDSQLDDELAYVQSYCTHSIVDEYYAVFCIDINSIKHKCPNLYKIYSEYIDSTGYIPAPSPPIQLTTNI